MVKRPNTRRNAKSNSFTYFTKFIKFFLIALLVTSMVGGLYVAKIVLDIGANAPEVSINRFLALSEPSIVVDNEGNQMDIIHTDEVRFPIPLSEMGDNIINAFISVEDERFEKHNGVDYRRTIGVTLRDLLGYITGNRDMQGGSTLTQQIIKNTFLTRDQKYERKIQEIFMAIEAEKMLTKDQILETYLNSIFLGGRANGVEAAARQYFNKSAKELSVVEAAYIAGTTQSPSVYYAFSRSSMANPQIYINRTKTVLAAMRDNDKITREEYNDYAKELDLALLPADEKLLRQNELTLALSEERLTEEEYTRQIAILEKGLPFSQTSLVQDQYNYEFFTRPVVDQVTRDLKAKKGYTDEEIRYLFAYGGLIIHSTMDRDAQEYAQSILSDFSNINVTYINSVKKTWGITEHTTIEEEVTEAEAAFSAMDYRTGQVKVIIGGRDHRVSNGYNYSYYSDTVQNPILRHIGSTTKPLTVYGPALEEGVITLGSPALDKRLDPSNPSDAAILRDINATGPYPNNFNFQYDGETTIRRAFVKSNNTVSVRTQYAIPNRIDTSIDYAEKFGLHIPKDLSKVGSSVLALGNYDNQTEDGGNPMILAQAYGAFGNNGIVTEAIVYTKVTDGEGNVLLEKAPESEQVFSPQNAYLLYDMMREVVQNNVPRAQLTSMPIAGKTGTASSTKNSVEVTSEILFAGLSPYYSSAIWIGSRNNSKIFDANTNATASSLLTQTAYGKIMAYLHEGLEVKSVPAPSGITTATFCYISGGIPNEQCYIENTVATDLFVTGTQPRDVCDEHTYEIPEIDPIPEDVEEDPEDND